MQPLLRAVLAAVAVLLLLLLQDLPCRLRTPALRALRVLHLQSCWGQQQPQAGPEAVAEAAAPLDLLGEHLQGRGTTQTLRLSHLL